MGAQIILDIVPQRITRAAWAGVWDEVRALLEAWPGRLLGHDWGTVAGVPLPMLTRSVERDPGDPTARRITVAGERRTLAAGAVQTLHRDLDRYLGRCPPDAAPPEDILHIAAGALDAADGAARAMPAYPVPPASRRGVPSGHVADGVVQVFGDAPAAPGCALPLLGAALLVEARLPRAALVHGDLDRAEAEAARRWAEEVLGGPIALPVRVDAWRLVERLGTRFSGPALVRAVERLYCCPPSKRDIVLLGLFSREDAEPWWLGKLCTAATARPGAVSELAAAYLEATGDLPRLCGLTCLDARGPRWPPGALVQVLATMRPRPDAAAVEHALALVFGAGAPRLVTAFRTALTSTGAPVSVRPAPDGAHRSFPDLLDGPATLSSPADLTQPQRDRVLALAWLARTLLEASGAPGEAAADRLTQVRAIATSMARSGPALTEDAWAWIEREQDLPLLRFLAAVAALDPADAAGPVARRAIFENRALAAYAAAASADAALMAAVSARVAAVG
jgi:hypothetical protein